MSAQKRKSPGKERGGTRRADVKAFAKNNPAKNKADNAQSAGSRKVQVNIVKSTEENVKTPAEKPAEGGIRICGDGRPEGLPVVRVVTPAPETEPVAQENTQAETEQENAEAAERSAEEKAKEDEEKQKRIDAAFAAGKAEMEALGGKNRGKALALYGSAENSPAVRKSADTSVAVAEKNTNNGAVAVKERTEGQLSSRDTGTQTVSRAEEKPKAPLSPAASADRTDNNAQKNKSQGLKAFGKALADKLRGGKAQSDKQGTRLRDIKPQKWKEMSVLRRVTMILCVALFLFSIVPLFIGVFTPGVVPPAMIAIFFFLVAKYWNYINDCRSWWWNILVGAVAVLVLAVFTYCAFVSGKMIGASLDTLPEDKSDVTVIVLGCKINGDQPSLMLQARLEKAADFLLANPNAHCVVSGGQGSDEDYPEAEIMKRYLVERGVSELRIICETQSTSTKENVMYSLALAEKYNCHDEYAIVTDRFHQYRAQRNLRAQGKVCYALNTETLWYLAMQYWFREIAAISRDWLVA